jgi:hypothetical protein
MNGYFPKIRIHAEGGALLVREGLNFTFYMLRPHLEVAQQVWNSLEAYIGAVGTGALGVYADEDGQWQKLDDAAWAEVRRELLSDAQLLFDLADASAAENRYRFIYWGKPASLSAGAVSAVSFWLPSEFLEEHGPGRVRELALELAAPLPFSSGHAGLAFLAEIDVMGVERKVRELSVRYPGMDIPDPSLLSFKLGTRVKGIHWLTFLGQPVLGELGGVAGLRARLNSPGTTVQEMAGERALVTLGEGPDAGDTEQGHGLPAYKELARVLEPWLYFEQRQFNDVDGQEERRRWERRFLDGP